MLFLLVPSGRSERVSKSGENFDNLFETLFLTEKHDKRQALAHFQSLFWMRFFFWDHGHVFWKFCRWVGLKRAPYRWTEKDETRVYASQDQKYGWKIYVKK